VPQAQWFKNYTGRYLSVYLTLTPISGISSSHSLIGAAHGLPKFKSLLPPKLSYVTGQLLTRVPMCRQCPFPASTSLSSMTISWPDPPPQSYCAILTAILRGSVLQQRSAHPLQLQRERRIDKHSMLIDLPPSSKLLCPSFKLD
jgi:hypothetical protein